MCIRDRIQGSIDIEMHPPPGRAKDIYSQYCDLSAEAVRRYGALDLIVWPESMFPEIWFTYDEGARVPAEWEGPPEDFLPALHRAALAGRRSIAELAHQFRTPLLLGIDRWHYDAQGVKHFNTAIHVAASGEVLASYAKMHLVMFGEYVPLSGWFPGLRELKPVNRLNLTLDPGDKPAAFELSTLRVAPNICYESVLPHVIRRQVRALAAEGREPHVLVNLTNDGWFWGSSELEMHFVCGVFRAVECRKPFLIAANTGISGWIDADGRIRARGPKRQTATLLAEPAPDARNSWYLRYGDWPAGICLCACVALAAVGCWSRRRTGTTPASPPTDRQRSG